MPEAHTSLAVVSRVVTIELEAMRKVRQRPLVLLQRDVALSTHLEGLQRLDPSGDDLVQQSQASLVLFARLRQILVLLGLAHLDSGLLEGPFPGLLPRVFLRLFAQLLFGLPPWQGSRGYSVVMAVSLPRELRCCYGIPMTR
jgi:hypothetical protein